MLRLESKTGPNTIAKFFDDIRFNVSFAATLFNNRNNLKITFVYCTWIPEYTTIKDKEGTVSPLMLSAKTKSPSNKPLLFEPKNPEGKY